MTVTLSMTCAKSLDFKLCYYTYGKPRRARRKARKTRSSFDRGEPRVHPTVSRVNLRIFNFARAQERETSGETSGGHYSAHAERAYGARYIFLKCRSARDIFQDTVDSATRGTRIVPFVAAAADEETPRFRMSLRHFSRLWLRSPPLVIRVQTYISAVIRIWRSRHALSRRRRREDVS